MLKEVYFLIVSGKFDRAPIQSETYPTDKEIADAIKNHNGTSAKVEKRFILADNQSDQIATVGEWK